MRWHPEPNQGTGASKSLGIKVSGKDGEKPALAPGLYIVATPIGNLRDITLRALDVLAGADLIACEDSRVTGKLLAAHGIATPMTAYHEHNAARARPKLLARIADAGAVALVSDAGMPLVSDPGYKLVAACRDADIPVTVIPGASASLTALAASGLPSDRFLFLGFLPNKPKARRAALAEVATSRASLIVFESNRRLAALLSDAAEILGPRNAAVCRELTKLHEEVARGELGELAAHYREGGAPRGEVVVIVAPPGEDDTAVDDDTLDRELQAALGRLSLRDAVAQVTQKRPAPRGGASMPAPWR